MLHPLTTVHLRFQNYLFASGSSMRTQFAPRTSGDKPAEEIRCLEDGTGGSEEG